MYSTVQFIEIRPRTHNPSYSISFFHPTYPQLPGCNGTCLLHQEEIKEQTKKKGGKQSGGNRYLTTKVFHLGFQYSGNLERPTRGLPKGHGPERMASSSLFMTAISEHDNHWLGRWALPRVV